MQMVKSLFSFQGRISRQPFWMGILGVYGFIAILGIIMSAFSDADGNSPYDGILVVALLPCIWIGLAIQVKRWHDRGRSGWRVLVNLIPIIGLIWVLVELGFLKGTTGENKYGDDPLSAVGSAYTT